MNIHSFVKEKAKPGHNGTILYAPVLPEGMKAPFDAAWGYLENGAAMEAHAHPTVEIYMIISGRGRVMVGNQWKPVGPSDVIEIPPDAMHTMACDDAGPLLWAALWWPAK